MIAIQRFIVTILKRNCNEYRVFACWPCHKSKCTSFEVMQIACVPPPECNKQFVAGFQINSLYKNLQGKYKEIIYGLTWSTALPICMFTALFSTYPDESGKVIHRNLYSSIAFTCDSTLCYRRFPLCRTCISLQQNTWNFYMNLIWSATLLRRVRGKFPWVEIPHKTLFRILSIK
jgi:hypothetical protein